MSYYRKHNYNRSYGHERALEHIRQAEDLSRELGGTDKDVKKYFFSLSIIQLKIILDKYQKQFGANAREYAESTFRKWKFGEVKMSGLVAERLFKLLPPIMPLETKFQLIESLWKHVGPSSSKLYYFGLNVDVHELSDRVKNYLENTVTNYNIPSNMEARFNWLSQGDVELKQQLLNYFRQQEKLLLSEAINVQLPFIIKNLKSEKGKYTTNVEQVLKVGKHEVKVEYHKKVDGISDSIPTSFFESDALLALFWIIVIVAIIVSYMK
ncbi:MAG: hypothetical protein H8E98_07160 [Bacteroidetes bacterium]|nr:hypothetical protein [Bacteroidota bacterium]